MESPRKRKRDKGTAFFNIGRNQEAGLRMSDTERRQLECEKVRALSPKPVAPDAGAADWGSRTRIPVSAERIAGSCQAAARSTRLGVGACLDSE